MAGSFSFEIIGEKNLHQAALPGRVACCPSMDLTALATADHQVLIYRLNGQRVYGSAQKSGSPRVEAIQWKPNGQLLAIAWSDGSVRLIGAESTKIAHQFSAGSTVSGVTCLAWASNLTGRRASSTPSKNDANSWQSLLSSDAVPAKESTPVDLPRDLALIDIEPSLPKLSVLAGGGSAEDVFSSRASLDALFRPFDPKDNDSVDVMMVGTKEGTIHLTIYDSFAVGSFSSPEIAPGSQSHVVRHASHEQYSTHALLVQGSASPEKVYFAPMDLRFVSSTSKNLSVLASRSTALQNLLRYIHQVQTLMCSEWKATQDLPGRFLGNINETLGEQKGHNIVQALYHSVATGHTLPAVREWLVDDLSERGYKRWDKAVMTGLENLRRLVHENMLPALDRCAVILSRLSGISKFQGFNQEVGFSTQQISLLMDTVACLHMISAKILNQVIDELDLFTAFSQWLHYEIDRLSSESSGSSNDDTAEKESALDHSKVLRYLQTAMSASPLAAFFGNVSEEECRRDWAQAEQGLPMFDVLDEELQKQDQGLDYMKALPLVAYICQHLSKQATVVFSKVAEAEKRNVLLGNVIELGSVENAAPMDMKMNEVDHSQCYAFVSFVPSGYKNQVRVIRIAMSIESGISTITGLHSATIQLGDGQIKDLKFLDSSTLFVTWEADDKTRILSIPFNPIAKTCCLAFSEHTLPGDKNIVAFSNEEIEARFSEQIFLDGAFVPDRLAVRPADHRPSSMEDTRRLVVLGKDNPQFKVLKLSERKDIVMV